MNDFAENTLGKTIKQRRIALSLALQELAAKSGVSASYLGRIERANILQKIAKPLGFEEHDLLILTRYLSPQSSMIVEKNLTYGSERLDPYVAKVLAQEPVEVQRVVLGILTILKSIARNMGKKGN